MDKLKEIVDTLSREDRKEFRIFINRQKNKKDRKDRDLFDLLQADRELHSDELLKKLYPDNNRQAYHALRKRLFRHLTDFIVLKRIEDDTTTAASVMGLISLSQFLFDKNADRLAWEFIRKAERTATNSEQHDLLNSVYNLQITQAHSEYGDPLEQIIVKYRENKSLADEDERANMAYSLIKQQLNEVRLQGKEIDFDNIVQEVLEEHQLFQAMAKRPGMLYKVISILRSAILAKKDYFSFEPYLIVQYEKMNREVGFSRNHHYYQVSLLYMIAHVLYRNKKFEKSIQYLRNLHEHLEAYNKSLHQRFYPRYALLLAANNTYLGRNQEAVDILVQISSDKQVRLQPSDELNIQLNLSVYYFQQEQFRDANRSLIKIGHTDKWCEKKMGKEWVLRKNMVEMLVQYELGNDDIAENRIRSMERQFGEFFKNPAYQRVRKFLELVRIVINKPMEVSSPAFFERVEKSFEFVPGEREDLLAIGFYAWLKSKMVQQPYYGVLLEIIGKL